MVRSAPVTIAPSDPLTHSEDPTRRRFHTARVETRCERVSQTSDWDPHEVRKVSHRPVSLSYSQGEMTHPDVGTGLG